MSWRVAGCQFYSHLKVIIFYEGVSDLPRPRTPPCTRGVTCVHTLAPLQHCIGGRTRLWGTEWLCWYTSGVLNRSCGLWCSPVACASAECMCAECSALGEGNQGILLIQWILCVLTPSVGTSYLLQSFVWCLAWEGALCFFSSGVLIHCSALHTLLLYPCFLYSTLLLYPTHSMYLFYVHSTHTHYLPFHP